MPIKIRKVLLAIGKVLLAIVLGCVAVVVGDMALGFLFGVLRAFGWPSPSFTAMNWILLVAMVLGLIIYRSRSNRKPAPPPFGK
jgi:uncharacterized membrane protein YdcZ (DUF606 family)